MAPEMYRGEQYDSRVDIYALGLVLYKLMNHNRLPFLNLEKQLITYRDKEKRAHEEDVRAKHRLHLWMRERLSAPLS